MINKNDVIEIYINDILTEIQKKEIYQFSIDFVNGPNYYNRQGGSYKEKVDKAYRGFVAEKILETYIKERDIKNIIFDGLLKYDPSQKTDNFDVMINGVTIDIKSSKETKGAGEYIDYYGNNYGNDYIGFALNNRNFILPVDQSHKDFIIQVLYNSDNTIAYIMGAINTEELTKNTPKKLKVSSNGYQETYMQKLKTGISLEYFLNNI